MSKKQSTFNRSASLPTRSKKGPPVIVYDSAAGESGLSSHDREIKVHTALKEIKSLAITAKKTYKKERKGGGVEYKYHCEDLILKWIPELKSLLGISTLEERTAREHAIAAEENLHHYTNRDLKRWNDAFELKRKYEDEINTLKNLHRQELFSIQQQHEEILRRSLREKDNQLKSLTEEKDNLLTRLSQIAGARLRDNNPAVSDLSDPNRPLKLSEKISELYDNEWTDAMEILEKDRDETMAVETLLSIILKCFSLCQKHSRFQLTSLSNALVLNEESTPDSTSAEKYAKDIQKSSSSWVLSDSNLHSIIWQEIGKTIGQQDASRCKPYIDKCVQYCWLMCIQDPPMHTVVFPRGLNFNSDEMKSFTKLGQFVDFTVWPAFYLHENGPLLSKAVVQGTNQAVQEMHSHKREEQTSGHKAPTSEYQKKINTQTTVHDGRTGDRHIEPHPVQTQRGYWEIRDTGYGNNGQRDYLRDSVDNYYSNSQLTKGHYVSYASPNPPFREGFQQQNIQKYVQSAVPSTVYGNKAYPPNKPILNSHENSHGRPDNQFRETVQGEHSHGRPDNQFRETVQGEHSHGRPDNQFRETVQGGRSHGRPDNQFRETVQGERSHGRPDNQFRETVQGGRSHGRPNNQFRETVQGERNLGAHPTETYKHVPPKTHYKTHGNPNASRTFYSGRNVYKSTEL
ncbi:uncharacterized protein LOC125679439 [Ostrea edulis]|uniref:uncharacterized protein LOC125679439 n=1 Tax=Ostrea edulis TaxID=37623 RepID=UPI0024AF0E48|nr:uncharacterized protein LOC125679439 [Ostrea edulis]